ncbi:MAG: hypothetical protein AB1896_22430 [Thermodesulfobacteriota bacterium]
MKTGIFGVALLANAAALFCLINPWFEQWRGQGLVFLIVEAAAAVLIGGPVLFYYFVRKKKSLGESLRETVDIILNFVSGWA